MHQFRIHTAQQRRTLRLHKMAMTLQKYACEGPQYPSQSPNALQECLQRLLMHDARASQPSGTPHQQSVGKAYPERGPLVCQVLLSCRFIHAMSWSLICRPLGTRAEVQPQLLACLLLLTMLPES